jgi:uncharacterized protein (DUF885 family)
MLRNALAVSLIALLSATAMARAALAQPATEAAAAPAASPAGQALREVFARADEADLKRNPLGRLFRGDLSHADQVGDFYSKAYYAAEKKGAEDDLAALARIDRSALSPDEQISYDVFKWQRSLDLRGLQPDLLKVSGALPIDHFNAIYARFADLSSGEGAAPYKTVKDYEDGLKRLDQFAVVLASAEDRMREGVAGGYVQPKLVMNNVVEQLDSMVADGVEGSAFYKPATMFPADMPAADQARLKAAYAAKVKDKVLPALARLRDYVRDDYLPHARDSVGLYDMKGGKELYRYLVEVNTTTRADPEAIHQIGLDEVARIQAEMEAIKTEVGFKGTLLEFFDYIRTDPKFKPASREALTQAYKDIGKRVDVALPKDFGHMPKAALDIRPVGPLTEKSAARGSYDSGTPDGSRPGVFYFNAYDLPSRTTPSMETLYLHEGAPGHHFQISLAQENASLPPFQRFGGNTAFVEGWGLYAETLGKELGMYTDPYQYFGHLDSELFRAIRLVVDTGIHAKGWTRDQSIDYILKNSSRGRTNATAEVERFIAIPGQALAYKTGQMKITALRARAEKALGPKFDVRDFHDQVLMTGALPLDVLEAKIDRWIAAKQAG